MVFIYCNKNLRTWSKRLNREERQIGEKICLFSKKNLRIQECKHLTHWEIRQELPKTVRIIGVKTEHQSQESNREEGVRKSQIFTPDPGETSTGIKINTIIFWTHPTCWPWHAFFPFMATHYPHTHTIRLQTDLKAPENIHPWKLLYS